MNNNKQYTRQEAEEALYDYIQSRIKRANERGSNDVYIINEFGKSLANWQIIAFNELLIKDVNTDFSIFFDLLFGDYEFKHSNKIYYAKIKNDVNGNPRYLISLTEKQAYAAEARKASDKQAIAISDNHGGWYRLGYIVKTYNIEELINKVVNVK